jgi:hypothetical protein
MSAAEPPELSVVIAIIAGGREPITACLQALEPDATALGVECIVPYDSRLDGVPELATRFPWVEFVDARATVDAKRRGPFSREHHDILRAIGLQRARGRVVALLEDHGIPAPGWCRTVLAAHTDADAAIGGAVENGVDRLLNWAVYYCDFGRYQNPVPEGPAEFLSDCNVSYKRAALASVQPLWAEAFHETAVNWELQRRGERMRLVPELVVHQTRWTLRLFPALVERYVWGRSIAGTRAQAMTAFRRLMLATLWFLLPLVLSWRVISQALRKRRHSDRLLLSIPLILLLETIWSAGELVGYLTASPTPRQI